MFTISAMERACQLSRKMTGEQIKWHLAHHPRQARGKGDEQSPEWHVVDDDASLTRNI